MDVENVERMAKGEASRDEVDMLEMLQIKLLVTQSVHLEKGHLGLFKDY